MNLVSKLERSDYWPATAMKHFRQKEYSRAIEICAQRLKDDGERLSGKIIYASSLYESGQIDEAERRFYDILRIDPDCTVALKYLGDIKFKAGDQTTAMSFYSRAQKIDPYTTGLSCEWERRNKEETKILTLKKGKEDIVIASEETAEEVKSKPTPKPSLSKNKENKLNELPFKTETIGDLLMAQGHSRLALQVFEELYDIDNSPRLKDKVMKIKEAIQPGKDSDV